MTTVQSMTTPQTTGGQRRVPTIWGLAPSQIHDRFWAARGVQVVRQGQPSEIVEGAELYLLTDPRSLVIFKIGQLIDVLSWLKPRFMFLRINDHQERGYREVARHDGRGKFLGFHRLYGGGDSRLARVALTNDLEVARLWQAADSPRDGWRLLRRTIAPDRRSAASVEGHVYDGSADIELMQYLRELLQVWKRPDATIAAARKREGNVWSHPSAKIEPGVKFIGSVWVGAGREVGAATAVVGPALLWDAPEAQVEHEPFDWLQIEPTAAMDRRVRQRSTVRPRPFKRAFDIVAAIIGLALTLPLYPFIILAIVIEDGWAPFFTHRRETKGGREFPCIKFRSMYNNSEEIKARLMQDNQADGPQFFIENDPRVTKVGRILRATQLDEVPQLWNVLLGDMSIVGPRPSPFKENQFCPPWREARLSVRPGITGLWQVERTRSEGEDFQEWIKYDIEYVENENWLMDLRILIKTFMVVLGKKKG